MHIFVCIESEIELLIAPYDGEDNNNVSSIYQQESVDRINEAKNRLELINNILDLQKENIWNHLFNNFVDLLLLQLVEQHEVLDVNVMIKQLFEWLSNAITTIISGSDSVRDICCACDERAVDVLCSYLLFALDLLQNQICSVAEMDMQWSEL